jgi:hypothetical protein
MHDPAAVWMFADAFLVRVMSLHAWIARWSPILFVVYSIPGAWGCWAQHIALAIGRRRTVPFTGCDAARVLTRTAARVPLAPNSKVWFQLDPAAAGGSR